MSDSEPWRAAPDISPGADIASRARRMLAEVVRDATVWLADVDDTLTDTAQMHRAASRSLVGVVRKITGETMALQIVERFEQIFDVLLASHQAAGVRAQSDDRTAADVELLWFRVNDCQQEIKQRWGATKKFSREVLLKLAAEDFGIILDADQLSLCADRYWEHVDANAIFLDGAIPMTDEIARIGNSLFLFTSSDARLLLKGNGQFQYDPTASLDFKRQRMEKLRQRGLNYREVFIGDPFDKPTPVFFAAIHDGVERSTSRRFDANHAVVLGDSFSSDLAVPISDWRVRLGILYRRGQGSVRIMQERLVSLGQWEIVRESLADSRGSRGGQNR